MDLTFNLKNCEVRLSRFGWKKNFNTRRFYFTRMNDLKRTMPVCFTPEQVKLLEKYAKEKGMLNFSQAVEQIISSNAKI